MRKLNKKVDSPVNSLVSEGKRIIGNRGGKKTSYSKFKPRCRCGRKFRNSDDDLRPMRSVRSSSSISTVSDADSASHGVYVVEKGRLCVDCQEEEEEDNDDSSSTTSGYGADDYGLWPPNEIRLSPRHAADDDVRDLPPRGPATVAASPINQTYGSVKWGARSLLPTMPMRRGPGSLLCSSSASFHDDIQEIGSDLREIVRSYTRDSVETPPVFNSDPHAERRPDPPKKEEPQEAPWYEGMSEDLLLSMTDNTDASSSLKLMTTIGFNKSAITSTLDRSSSSVASAPSKTSSAGSVSETVISKEPSTQKSKPKRLRVVEDAPSDEWSCEWSSESDSKYGMKNQHVKQKSQEDGLKIDLQPMQPAAIDICDVPEREEIDDVESKSDDDFSIDIESALSEAAEEFFGKPETDSVIEDHVEDILDSSPHKILCLSTASVESQCDSKASKSQLETISVAESKKSSPKLPRSPSAGNAPKRKSEVTQVTGTTKSSLKLARSQSATKFSEIPADTTSVFNDSTKSSPKKSKRPLNETKSRLDQSQLTLQSVETASKSQADTTPVSESRKSSHKLSKPQGSTRASEAHVETMSVAAASKKSSLKLSKSRGAAKASEAQTEASLGKVSKKPSLKVPQGAAKVSEAQAETPPVSVSKKSSLKLSKPQVAARVPETQAETMPVTASETSSLKLSKSRSAAKLSEAQGETTLLAAAKKSSLKLPKSQKAARVSETQAEAMSVTASEKSSLKLPKSRSAAKLSESQAEMSPVTASEKSSLKLSKSGSAAKLSETPAETTSATTWEKSCLKLSKSQGAMKAAKRQGRAPTPESTKSPLRQLRSQSTTRALEDQADRTEPTNYSSRKSKRSLNETNTSIKQSQVTAAATSAKDKAKSCGGEKKNSRSLREKVSVATSHAATKANDSVSIASTLATETVQRNSDTEPSRIPCTASTKAIKGATRGKGRRQKQDLGIITETETVCAVKSPRSQQGSVRSPDYNRDSLRDEESDYESEEDHESDDSLPNELYEENCHSGDSCVPLSPQGTKKAQNLSVFIESPPEPFIPKLIQIEREIVEDDKWDKVFAVNPCTMFNFRAPSVP